MHGRILLRLTSTTSDRMSVGAHHHPGDPGSRPGKSPLCGPLVLCRLTFGSGTSLHPCRLSPPPASLRTAPVSRQRLIDFQPDPVIAVTVSFSLRGVIAVKRHISGDSTPYTREGAHRAVLSGTRLVPAMLITQIDNPVGNPNQ